MSGQEPTLQQIILYMVQKHRFNFQYEPTGYICFEAGGNVPNASRYSAIYKPGNPKDFTVFVKELAVYALEREAEKEGVIYLQSEYFK